MGAAWGVLETHGLQDEGGTKLGVGCWEITRLPLDGATPPPPPARLRTRPGPAAAPGNNMRQQCCTASWHTWEAGTTGKAYTLHFKQLARWGATGRTCTSGTAYGNASVSSAARALRRGAAPLLPPLPSSTTRQPKGWVSRSGAVAANAEKASMAGRLPLLVAGPTNALAVPVVNAVARVLDACRHQRARSAAASDPVGNMVPRTNVVDQE